VDILVCIKQVVDPELPLRDFAIDPATRRQARDGRPLVISTYDENALEVALQLKDARGGKVTALTIGPAASVGDSVRLALAMGADGAVVVDEPRSPHLHGVERAAMLAAACRRAGPFDLVLTGCESADWVERAVAPWLAEALGAACVTFVTRIDPAPGGATVSARRLADDGVHTVEVRLPAVISVASDDANRPRLPKVRDIMAAKRKPVQSLAASDLGMDAGAGAGLDVLDVTVPQRTGACEVLTGAPADQVATLTERLRDLKLL
jgi:electron transfer flavoprotein beta subunit